MHRHFIGSLLALLTVGLIAAPSASAGDENAALREQVKQLSEKVDALSQQQSAQLEKEVDAYLAEQAAKSAEGGKEGWVDRFKIWAQLGSVLQFTVGLDPSDAHAVSGDCDVWFEFTATENLWIIAHATGNTGGNLPDFSQLGPTLGGFNDGIDVDGTVPTTGGSFVLEEAYIQHRIAVGDKWLWWAMGKIDPRRRYGQTAFTEDENRQFLNNNFDDPAGLGYQNGAFGGTPIAAEFWMSFGDHDQIMLNTGWYNAPGQWFTDGQFYIQGTWTGDVSGRQMHVRIYFLYDSVNEDLGGDPTYGFGAAWDWWVTDSIGLFARITANTNDDLGGNPVDWDLELGAVFTKLISSRPSDTLGVGLAHLNVSDNVVSTFFADREWTFEIYYNFIFENGKASITPDLQIVIDPGIGLDYLDDLLVLLGIRFNFQF